MSKAHNGKLQLNDHLNARARSKTGKFKRDSSYSAKNINFVPAILSVSGNIHPAFMRLL